MIRWSARASDDLDAISNYIARNNVDAAVRHRLKIVHAVQQLDKFPFSGQATTSVLFRKLNVPGTNYVIFYRVKRDVVLISRVQHGAQIRS